MITFVIVSFGDKYNRYRQALIRSINANMPEANIKDIELDPFTEVNFHLANYIKLKHWKDNIEGDTILIDADTIVLGDVSKVFDMPFDLIYTKRSNNSKIPFNSGVVFVKESGKRIIEEWQRIDERMINDKIFHAKWKTKYFGFNQASFGCLLETIPELSIGHVPSEIYNSCDIYDWRNNYTSAKIVHVKSGLRKSLERNINQFRFIENRVKKYYESK